VLACIEPWGPAKCAEWYHPFNYSVRKIQANKVITRVHTALRPETAMTESLLSR